MSVSVRVVIEIERDRQAVFDYTVEPANMPKYLRAVGPVPSVERAYILGNGPVKTGAVRRVVLGDGTPLDEEITAHEPPRTHSYRVKGLRGPLRYLTRRMESEMIFSPLGNGTRLTWTYTFEPVSILAQPIVTVFARRLFKRWMREGVGRIKSLLEAIAPTTHASVN